MIRVDAPKVVRPGRVKMDSAFWPEAGRVGRRIEAAPQLTPPLASHHQADHFETTNDTPDFTRIWLVQVLKTSTSSSARSCACSKASAAAALQRCVCRNHPSRVREAFLPNAHGCHGVESRVPP